MQMELLKSQFILIRNYFKFNFHKAIINKIQKPCSLNRKKVFEDVKIPKKYEPIIKYLYEQSDLKDDWVHVKNYKNLPKLPVPPLKQTIKKYEQKMEILLDKEEYARLKTITKKFVEDESLGPKLQRFLLDRQKKLDNWAYDYWIDDMYLAVNAPSPIYSNTGEFHKNQIDDICCFGAHFVVLAVMMETLMELNIFPRENYFKTNKPLCMDQYYYLFNSYRIPGKEKDKSEVYHVQNKKHIIVMHQNVFYYVPIQVSASGVDKNAIYSNLKSIINNSSKESSLPIGVLTTLERREWWNTREILKKNSINRSNLKLIETALLIICLDKPILNNFPNISEDDHNILMLKQALCGGGINENSGNRWYDKTAQTILSESYHGFCMEHSLVDGVVCICTLNALFNNALKMSNADRCKYEEVHVDFVKLNWLLSDEIIESINNAALKFDKLVNDFDLKIWTFTKFGSKYIKSQKCSPDGFVQLILQLTYYKMHGKLCATYESSSTRRFRKGRIDCIRPTTPEVFQWVKVMSESTILNVIKLKLWEKALNAQYKESKDVHSGQGIDVHLLGLREAAKEILDELPELFSDRSYFVANKFIMSTSQIGAPEYACAGYGAPINDGYGILYSIHDSCIQFSVSSFYSAKQTSSLQYLEKLKESCDEVYDMLENKRT